MKTHTFRAMGSRILIAMDTDDPVLSEASLDAVRWFDEWEQHFSRFRLTSELSELNRNSGQRWQVSATFWQVIKLALEVEKKTGGLVTPSTLNALEEAGYTVSFEDLAGNIESILRQPLQPSGDIRDIEMDESTYTLRLPSGMRLDLGGIVKGWAAQQTMIRLRQIAPVLVDAGGDIAISGPMRDGSSWPIGVANPFEAEQNLNLIMVSKGGVATSGRDYRRWIKNGQWQHHIIDPRVDRSAETDVVSATVIAEDVIEAEAYAKMVLILGSNEAIKKLSQEIEVAYFLVLEDGTQRSNENFNEYLWNEKWPNLQSKLLA